MVGHELGHIYQQRTGKFVFNTDKEWDADYWGLWMAMVAGYDPYAAAGVFGKLGMATGTANLGILNWENYQPAATAHSSFSTMINNLTAMIESLCSSSTAIQNACNQYKSLVHPYFPSQASVPLLRHRRTDEPGELNRPAGGPMPETARRARWSYSRSTGGLPR